MENFQFLPNNASLPPKVHLYLLCEYIPFKALKARHSHNKCIWVFGGT